MERALDITNKVTCDKGMELSCKKCSIMRFGPGAMQEKEWKLENNMGTILESKVFKYLGILIGSSRTYTQLRRFTKRRIPGLLGLLKIKSSETPNKLIAADLMWRQGAKQTLLYGTEVIPLNKEGIRQIEVAQNKVGKWMLGLKKNASSIGLRGELGWRSIKREIQMRKLIF